MDLITIKHKDHLAFEVRVRRQRVKTDMAPSDGGAGAGMTPAELLAGSLGACIAMSVQGYCETCGHGDGDVCVNLGFQLLGKPPRIGVIVVDVEVPEGVPPDREAAVRRIVEHCVIHETLRHPPEVDVDIIMGQHQRTPEPASVGPA